MTTEVKTPSLSTDEIYSLARGERILDGKWREPTKWEIYLAQQIEIVTQERDALRQERGAAWEALRKINIEAMAACYREAGRLCPTGYQVMSETATAQQIDVDFAVVKRTLTVECK